MNMVGIARADESAEQRFAAASKILTEATTSNRVRAAAIYFRDGKTHFTQTFGDAREERAAFLLGSISKPIAMTALMTLFDQGLFQLDDPAAKFVPEFRGGGRERVTLRHLLSHTSGLPDQLPNNARLRASHAPLEAFVAETVRLPLAFAPGTAYEYSSMGIMLAADIAQRIAGQDIKRLVHKRVFEPLGMQHSAMAMDSLDREHVMMAQVEFGAKESGGGSAESRDWDWNSRYWRNLGAPWGGVQASAPDVGRFFEAMIDADDGFLSAETKRLMTVNHNPAPLPSRGLAFDVDMRTYAPACSAESFGHTGSTGTIAWADRTLDRVCVVLTTLPAEATPAEEHPRHLASFALGQPAPR